MKSFIILAVVLCLVASGLSYDLNDVQKTKIISHAVKCIKQENLNDEEAAKVITKDFSDPTENLKCFATCLFEKIGILKDSKIQEDVVKAKLTSVIGVEKTKTVLEHCGSIRGKDRCDIGYQVFNCVEEAKKGLNV